MSEPVETVVPAESPAVVAAKRRVQLVKLGAVALVLAVGGVLVLRGYDVRGAIEQGLAYVRSAGPAVFFLAMAILPALGAPQMGFSLAAGPLFGAQLGTGVVVLLALLAMLFNMAFTYWLACRVLRPVLEVLFKRLGYKLPQLTPENETDLIVMLRVTPGVPFTVQNHLLGLARARFGRYLLISFAIQAPLNAAVIVFSDAIQHGKGKTALFGISLILFLLMGTNLLRKYYAKKRA